MKNSLLIITFILTNLISFAQEGTSPIDIDSLRTETVINEIPFSIIEDIPIYKGCNKTDTADLKRKCMSSKISSFITKNFNESLLNHLDIEPGKIRIIAQFEIDTIGNVSAIKTKSKYPILKAEANRVLKLIPQFDSPGKFKGKPVKVPFTLPILLYKKNVSEVIFPTHKRCTKIENNKLLKKCTNQNISDYIQLSINLELASKLFPTQKNTKFLVSFTVDKKGAIKNITAKAHHKKMAIEVIQTLKRMPKFKKPATLNGDPVEYNFSRLMRIDFY